MISEDEYLERVVAGIMATTTAEADVRWNELINDRQFDVSVRFRLGTLNYLILIEVKNRSRKASAADLDAFVTKARDQNASKAVFVTAAGFQSGALSVAQRHGVELFTVSFDKDELTFPAQAGSISIRNPKYVGPDVEPEICVGSPHLICNIEKIVLNYADGSRAALPTEPSQMTYYVGKSRLRDGRTIADLLDERDFPEPELEQTLEATIKLTPSQRLVPPDEYMFRAGVVSGLKLTLTGTMGRPIGGNVKIDPGMLLPPVLYTNVLTGEVQKFTMDQIPLGRSQITPGGFYFIRHPLAYYHCEAIEGDLIRWNLIESFQNGELISATYTQKSEWAGSYIPVADKKTLKRVKSRLDDYRGRGRKAKT